MMKITAIPPLTPQVASPRAAAAAAPERAGFQDMLKTAFNEVNHQIQDADRMVQDMATAKQKDIHGTMIALEKADVSFQLLMQVRNKVVSAYETIMRMQV